MTTSAKSLSFEERELVNIRNGALKKYRKEKMCRLVVPLVIICCAAILVTVAVGSLGKCVKLGLSFEMASVPVSLTIAGIIFMSCEFDTFSDEMTVSEMALLHAGIWTVGLILFAASLFLMFIPWDLAAGTSLERAADMVSLIPAIFLAGKAAVHLAKAVRAWYRAKNAEKARPKVKSLIEEVLFQKGRIVFKGSSRRTGAAIMPDGTIRKVDLGEYADALIKEVPEICPGTCLDSIMTAVPTGKAGRTKSWAAAVRRDAKRKCDSLAEAYMIAGIKGPHIIGLTKTGQVIDICFRDNVLGIFDSPEELIGRKRVSGTALRKKLLPVGVIAAIKGCQKAKR